MPAPTYADVDDYAAYMGVASTFEIPPRVMIRASRAIDKALVGAVYATDVDGAPTDTELADVLKDATCAQAHPLVKKLMMLAECPGKPLPPGMHHIDDGLTTEAYDILRAAGLLPVTLRMYG